MFNAWRLFFLTNDCCLATQGFDPPSSTDVSWAIAVFTICLGCTSCSWLTSSLINFLTDMSASTDWSISDWLLFPLVCHRQLSCLVFAFLHMNQMFSSWLYFLFWLFHVNLFSFLVDVTVVWDPTDTFFYNLLCKEKF